MQALEDGKHSADIVFISSQETGTLALTSNISFFDVAVADTLVVTEAVIAHRPRSRCRMPRRSKEPPPALPPAPIPAARPDSAPVRERAGRPQRLKALHEEHPRATFAKLAQLYEARFGKRLTQKTVSLALPRVGVLTREEQHRECQLRPQRIAELCSTLPAPTKDTLADAYYAKYGVRLIQLSRILRKLGINLLEPRRKPDRDETEHRPERLYKLAAEFPELNYDALGRKYEEIYEIRLGESLVGQALRKYDLYRQRLVDAEEFAERPERVKALRELYPDLTAAQLAAEYERRYDIKLDASAIQRTLERLGYYRQGPVDRGERQERLTRLQALLEQYPSMTYPELAQEYEKRYLKKISPEALAEWAKRLGIFRALWDDPKESKLRRERLAAIAQEFPSAPVKKLAGIYKDRFLITLTEEQVTRALLPKGPRNPWLARPTPRTPPALVPRIAERGERLKAIYERDPSLSTAALVKEYEREYGIALNPGLVVRTLSALGIHRYRGGRPPRPIDRDELQQRGQRLQALLSQSPDLSYQQLAQEYQREYGISINPEAVTRALAQHTDLCEVRARKANQYKQQRRKRLEKLYREDPSASSFALVQEYYERYDDVISPGMLRYELNRIGIYCQRRHDREERRARAERLAALRRKNPSQTYQELADKYAKQYGVVLVSSTVGKTLVKHGVVPRPKQPRDAVAAQRVERMKGIAAENPDASKMELVREYGRRYGGDLSISSRFRILSRCGVLAGR